MSERTSDLPSALDYECPTCGAARGAHCPKRKEPCEARGDLYEAALEHGRALAAEEIELEDRPLGGKVLDGSARFARAREERSSPDDPRLEQAELEGGPG